MKRAFFLITFLACFYALSAQQKEIETIADIKSVTIYNASAEINYTKEIMVPAGKSTIVFSEMTPHIVENTVNVSADGGGVDIITVTEKINFIKERKEQNRMIVTLTDTIKYLEREINLLRCKTEAFTKEKELLFKDEPIGGVAKGVAVSEIEKASVFFSRRFLELTTGLYELKEQENIFQNYVNHCRNQLKEFSNQNGITCSEILITVMSPQAQKVVFNFSFLTPKAGWAPSYDCRYQGTDKPLGFVFRANVFNACGIDWNNVDIKLSTANPTAGFDKPTINTGKQNETVQNTVQNSNIQYRVIEVSSTIAEYDIKFKYSIPSDSKPYLLDVTSYEIKADFYYLLIPSVDPFGFLMAKIPDWNKYNLISGTTNIYNKGSFMGKTFLNTYAENDTLGIYLGKDNTVHAVRKEVNKTNLNAIIGNYYIDKSDISISIKNNSSDNLNVQLLEQVPVFDTYDKAKFNMTNTEQAAYNKKEGLLTWNFQIEPNGTKLLDYNFEAKIPKNDIGNYSPPKRKTRAISCPSF